MGRRGVEVEVVLLDVFAVVALVAGKTEGALLENRILAIPHRKRETQALFVITDTSHAIFAPAVGPRARLIVVEVFPGCAALAVVLAYGARRARRGTVPIVASLRDPAAALRAAAVPHSGCRRISSRAPKK